MTVNRHALTPEQRRYFNWMDKPYVNAVVAALLSAAPDGVRFVGGCVRDSLMGIEPKDIDIAVTLTPDETTEALKAMGLGAVPTGIDHGTVTAIVDHRGIEVTTLRADVSTDGRRASVAFTHDWTVDARRRDFTMNALYLTPDGVLYDPVHGLPDIAARTVRFIGNADDRIREDYLRILRFFRFTARFCDGFDPTGLTACTDQKEGIASLSAERIGEELMAILALPRAAFALEAMEAAGILREIWQGKPDVGAVARLKSVAENAVAPLCLAALYDRVDDGLGARLRLSNAEKAVRSKALRILRQISPDLSGKDLRRLIYCHGQDGTSDALSLAYAKCMINEAELARLRETAASWSPPIFPYSGKDVVAAGIEAGPQISAILAAVEQQWVDEDFPANSRLSSIFSDLIENTN